MNDQEVNEIIKEGKRQSRRRSIIIFLAIIAPIAIFIIIALTRPEPLPTPINNFISEFGKPDSIYSSENEVPPPPIIAQMLFYKEEHINVAYYLSDDGWKLLGFIDTRTNKPLELKEAIKRLAPEKLNVKKP